MKTISKVIATVSILMSASFAQAFQAVPYEGVVVMPIRATEKSVAQNQLVRMIKEAKAQGWEVQVQETSTFALSSYTKFQGESLEDIVVLRTKGCVSLDQQCLKRINNINGGRTAPKTVEEFNAMGGNLLLPHAQTQYIVSIYAGENYRESVSGNTVVAEMSRALLATIQNVSDYLVVRPAQVCAVECVNAYHLTIVD
ncbi:hypothetical protein D3C87_102740 [compost metagenome]